MKIILIFISMLMSTITYSQFSNKSAIYFQLCGNGLFSSINYKKSFNKENTVQGSIGVGFYGIKNVEVTFPINLLFYSFINSLNTNYVSYGVGLTYSKAEIIISKNQDKLFTNSTPSLRFIPSFGYGHVFKRKNYTELNFTPLIKKNEFVPYIGFSVGKQF